MKRFGGNHHSHLQGLSLTNFWSICSHFTPSETPENIWSPSFFKGYTVKWKHWPEMGKSFSLNKKHKIGLLKNLTLIKNRYLLFNRYFNHSSSYNVLCCSKTTKNNNHLSLFSKFPKAITSKGK